MFQFSFFTNLYKPRAGRKSTRLRTCKAGLPGNLSYGTPARLIHTEYSFLLKGKKN